MQYPYSIKNTNNTILKTKICAPAQGKKKNQAKDTILTNQEVYKKTFQTHYKSKSKSTNQ